MPLCRSLRSWLLACLLAVLGCLSPMLAHAQAPAAPPPPPSAPSAELANPHAQAVALPRVQLTDPGALELSQRRMNGPGAEVVVGGVLVLSTPLVFGMVMVVAGPPILACLNFGEPDEEQAQCEREAARQEQSAARLGAFVSVLTGGAGIALLTHGAMRIRRIRQARRHVALTLGDFALAPGGASFGLHGRF